MNKCAKHWLYLHDGKPGHLNQLRGLNDALEASATDDTSTWLDVTKLSFAARSFALGAAIKSLPAADVIVAIGHSTHWLSLLLGRKLRAHTVVVMRPSLPMSWFDSILIPKHDTRNTQITSNIYVTEGAMNVLGYQSYNPSNKGLVLLGGDSKHFEWPSTQVTAQVCAIIDSQPDLEWTVSDSRRSPECQLSDIQAACPNATIQSHANCPKGWLIEQMRQAKSIWVTPDSVSMVYEALSSGASVGLIELPSKSKNRINRSMLALIAKGKVSSVSQGSVITRASGPLPRLNEAENAAAWLLRRV